MVLRGLIAGLPDGVLKHNFSRKKTGFQNLVGGGFDCGVKEIFSKISKNINFMRIFFLVLMWCS